MTFFENAFSPFRVNQLQLRNRFIKTATYEGMYENGLPTQELINHHARLARGGVAMTTVAYGAVHPDGRTHSAQMYLRKEVIPTSRQTDPGGR